jgi:hypothetical protein
MARLRVSAWSSSNPVEITLPLIEAWLCERRPMALESCREKLLFFSGLLRSRREH